MLLPPYYAANRRWVAVRVVVLIRKVCSRYGLAEKDCKCMQLASLLKWPENIKNGVLLQCVCASVCV